MLINIHVHPMCYYNRMQHPSGKLYHSLKVCVRYINITAYIIKSFDFCCKSYNTLS